MFIQREWRSLSFVTDAFFYIQNKNYKNYLRIQTFGSEPRYKRSIFDKDLSLFIACGGSEDYGGEHGQCGVGEGGNGGGNHTSPTEFKGAL